MLGISYAPEHDPLLALKKRSHAVVSCYAQGRDYHDVLSSALKRVAVALQRASGAAVKVFVDTAPLMEKPLAAAAARLISKPLGPGLGKINACVISNTTWRHVSNVPENPGTLKTCRHLNLTRSAAVSAAPGTFRCARSPRSQLHGSSRAR